jgi:hypothetical protein
VQKEGGAAVLEYGSQQRMLCHCRKSCF